MCAQLLKSTLEWCARQPNKRQQIAPFRPRELLHYKAHPNIEILRGFVQELGHFLLQRGTEPHTAHPTQLARIPQEYIDTHH